MSYAELHCLSNFSFQRGASTALELFERAKRQGYGALAITDECTLAGIVRAWQAASGEGPLSPAARRLRPTAARPVGALDRRRPRHPGLDPMAAPHLRRAPVAGGAFALRAG